MLQYYATIYPPTEAKHSQTTSPAGDTMTSLSCDDEHPIAWLSDEQFEEEEEDECIMGKLL